jgi:hypothetical protein
MKTTQAILLDLASTWLTAALMLTALLFAASLFGCGDSFANPPASIDPVLGNYLVDFLAASSKAKVSIPAPNLLALNKMFFIEMDSRVHVGFCDYEKATSPTGVHNTRLIAIDQNYWTGLNDCERRALVYHELGHCLLDLPDLHNPEDMSSVMFESAQYDPTPNCAFSTKRINVMLQGVR